MADDTMPPRTMNASLSDALCAGLPRAMGFERATLRLARTSRAFRVAVRKEFDPTPALRVDAALSACAEDGLYVRDGRGVVTEALASAALPGWPPASRAERHFLLERAPRFPGAAAQCVEGLGVLALAEFARAARRESVVGLMAALLDGGAASGAAPDSPIRVLLEHADLAWAETWCPEGDVGHTDHEVLARALCSEPDWEPLDVRSAAIVHLVRAFKAGPREFAGAIRASKGGAIGSDWRLTATFAIACARLGCEASYLDGMAAAGHVFDRYDVEELLLERRPDLAEHLVFGIGVVPDANVADRAALAGADALCLRLARHPTHPVVPDGWNRVVLLRPETVRALEAAGLPPPPDLDAAALTTAVRGNLPLLLDLMERGANRKDHIMVWAAEQGLARFRELQAMGFNAGACAWADAARHGDLELLEHLRASDANCDRDLLAKDLWWYHEPTIELLHGWGVLDRVAQNVGIVMERVSRPETDPRVACAGHAPDPVPALEYLVREHPAGVSPDVVLQAMARRGRFDAAVRAIGSLAKRGFIVDALSVDRLDPPFVEVARWAATARGHEDEGP